MARFAPEGSGGTSDSSSSTDSQTSEDADREVVDRLKDSRDSTSAGQDLADDDTSDFDGGDDFEESEQADRDVVDRVREDRDDTSAGQETDTRTGDTSTGGTSSGGSGGGMSDSPLDTGGVGGGFQQSEQADRGIVEQRQGRNERPDRFYNQFEEEAEQQNINAGLSRVSDRFRQSRQGVETDSGPLGGAAADLEQQYLSQLRDQLGDRASGLDESMVAVRRQDGQLVAELTDLGEDILGVNPTVGEVRERVASDSPFAPGDINIERAGEGLQFDVGVDYDVQRDRVADRFLEQNPRFSRNDLVFEPGADGGIRVRPSEDAVSREFMEDRDAALSVRADEFALDIARARRGELLSEGRAQRAQEGGEPFGGVTTDTEAGFLLGAAEDAYGDVSSGLSRDIDRFISDVQGTTARDLAEQSARNAVGAGLFVGDLLLEGPDSPQVTDVDEQLRGAADYAFDVSFGGEFAERYSPQGGDDVTLSGPEVDVGKVVDLGVQSTNIASGAALGQAYADFARDASTDPVGTARNVGRAVGEFTADPVGEIGERVNTDVLSDEGQGELDQDVLRSLTAGDGLIGEGTRELDAPPQQLTNPFGPGAGDLSDSELRERLADANPGVDAGDITVQRDDGQVSFGVDLDEQDVRERVAAQNPGIDPDDVVFSQDAEGNIEYVTPEGTGFFSTTEFELRQKARAREETFGFEQEAEGFVSGLIGEGTVSSFVGGLARFPGQAAAAPSNILLATDAATEIAPNIPGTVEQFGVQDTLTAGLEVAGRTEEAFIQDVEEDPAGVAGEITGEALAGFTAGFVGKRGLVAARGRRTIPDVDPQGSIDIRDIERPEIREGKARLTTFSKRSVPEGQRSLDVEDFPVEPQETPEAELNLLARTFSDPDLEDALGVQGDEVTLFSARTGLKGESFEPRSGRPYDPDAGFFAGSVARNFLPLGSRGVGFTESLRRLRPRLPRPVQGYRSLRDAGDPDKVPNIVATAGRLRTLPEDVRTRGEITDFLQERRQTGEFFVRQADNQSGEAEAVVSAVGSDKIDPWEGAGRVDYGEASRFVKAGEPFETQVGGLNLPGIGQLGGEKVSVQLYRPETDPDADLLDPDDSVNDLFDFDDAMSATDPDVDAPDLDVGDAGGFADDADADSPFDQSALPDSDDVADDDVVSPFDSDDTTTRRGAGSEFSYTPGGAPGTPVVPTFLPSSDGAEPTGDVPTSPVVDDVDMSSPTTTTGSGDLYSPTPDDSGGETTSPTGSPTGPSFDTGSPFSPTTTTDSPTITPTYTPPTTTEPTTGTPFIPTEDTPQAPGELPDLDLEADQRRDERTPFGARKTETVDFVNPLTGEVLKTETDF